MSEKNNYKVIFYIVTYRTTAKWSRSQILLIYFCKPHINLIALPEIYRLFTVCIMMRKITKYCISVS